MATAAVAAQHIKQRGQQITLSEGLTAPGTTYQPWALVGNVRERLSDGVTVWRKEIELLVEAETLGANVPKGDGSWFYRDGSGRDHRILTAQPRYYGAEVVLYRLEAEA